MPQSLPPGQFEVATLPRFGLPPFAQRFPTEWRIELGLTFERGADPLPVAAQLLALPRVETEADLHCVTSWTRRSLLWGGFRFADFYERVMKPHVPAGHGGDVVVFRGQDGYHASLPLDDLLGEEVLLADHLEGLPLPIAHGAPLRLVAPERYAYKSVKHVSRIELRRAGDGYRAAGLAFMAHPRARAALEERGRWLPGWMLRYAYRPFIVPTADRFRRALERHLANALP